MKTKKMVFPEDVIRDGVCVYEAGKKYDIPEESVDRWSKRGAVLASDKEEAKAIIEAVKEHRQHLQEEAEAIEAEGFVAMGEDEILGDDSEYEEVVEESEKKSGKKKKKKKASKK